MSSWWSLPAALPPTSGGIPSGSIRTKLPYEFVVRDLLWGWMAAACLIWGRVHVLSCHTPWSHETELIQMDGMDLPMCVRTDSEEPHSDAACPHRFSVNQARALGPVRHRHFEELILDTANCAMPRLQGRVDPPFMIDPPFIYCYW